MYALADADVPLFDPQQGLLPLPGLDPVAKHYMAVAQFTLRIEPLLQSGAVSSTGPGRRSFLLVAGGNDFGGGPLHSATKYTEMRGNLTQVSIHSDRDPLGVPTEEGWAGKGTYRLTLSLCLGATAAHHMRYPRAPIVRQSVHPLDARQVWIGRGKRRRPRRGGIGGG
jgi:hypothetical protein